MPPRHSFPAEIATFIGREHEVTEISHALHQGHLRTLTGVGGSGKTRLALRVATGVSTDFPHGVWLVPLASHSTASGLWFGSYGERTRRYTMRCNHKLLRAVVCLEVWIVTKGATWLDSNSRHPVLNTLCDRGSSTFRSCSLSCPPRWTRPDPREAGRTVKPSFREARPKRRSRQTIGL
jgi:hypothetical protein